MHGEYDRDIVGAFTFQIFMKKSFQEMVLLTLFDNQIQSFIPLNKFLTAPATEISFPVTIIMGDDDWVLKCDDGASQIVIEHL